MSTLMLLPDEPMEGDTYPLRRIELPRKGFGGRETTHTIVIDRVWEEESTLKYTPMINMVRYERDGVSHVARYEVQDNG